jgi:hypothetical protein
MNTKMIEIGDKVRFLNEVGGGIVSKIEGSLVFVEDEDGFEIPIPYFEAVVVEKKSVEKVNASTTFEQQNNSEIIDNPEDDLEEEIIEDETLDDTDPKIYLAFITTSIVIDQKSKLNIYLINDSNYFCSFLISELNDDGLAMLMYNGIINPNTKLTIDEKEIATFNKEWTIQLMLYKKEKTYIPLHPVSTSIKFTPNRFYRQNSFEGNDFFHQSAHLISLMKYELEKKMQSLTEDDTQKVILEKEVKQQPKTSEKRADTKELLEIDLHIHELIDDLRGLSNAEMLKIQLDKFNSVMEANILNKGKKIVFIHGVGNGTLKTELRKQLEQNYKGLYYLDASFKEYGFGATMVIM